jgi:thiopeptide-type bacteriocin biosynthesis protein
MRWLSFHVYPLETQDVFLVRALKPFLAQSVWPVKGARAFFIRFEDEKGPHLRVRVRGEQDWLDETLRPVLEGWFADRAEIRENEYTGEVARFGGETGLMWAEEHFHISTRVALDRLAQTPYTYGDALFDALRLHVSAARAAGFDRKKTAWYFSRLEQQWLPLYFRPADGAAADDDFKSAVRNSFAKSFEPQRETLKETLDGLWAALEAGQFDPAQPEWLRWHRGNELVFKELGDNLEKALPSLIHLTNNRLGINNQDEVYLNYILSQVSGLGFQV